MGRRLSIALFAGLLIALIGLIVHLFGTLNTANSLLESVPQALLLTVIVAFGVFIEVPLSSGSLNLGYAAGLLALLTLGRGDNLFTAFFVIFVGGLIGAAMRAVWRERRAGGKLSPGTVGSAVIPPIQLGWSFLFGTVFYLALNGDLPFTALTLKALPPLFALLIGSLTVYLAIDGLALVARGRRFARRLSDNRNTLLVALILPLPFEVVAALLAKESTGGFLLLVIGLISVAGVGTHLAWGRLRARQQLRELSSLSVVARTVRANLELSALLQTIYLQVAALLEVNNCTLALYDPDGDIVRFPLVYRDGVARTLPPRLMGPEPIDAVITKKAALLLESGVARGASARKLSPPPDNPQSWLGVPLVSADRVLGAISIASHDPARHFTVDDRRRLSAIASQSALALDNAQLYRQTQERARQLAALNALATRLSGTLDPQRVLDRVIGATAEITRAEAGALFLWDTNPEHALPCVRSFGVSISYPADPPPPLLTGQMRGDAPTVAPIIISGKHRDLAVEPFRTVAAREGFSGWVELPLQVGTERLGVLIAYYRQPFRLPAEEIDLLRTFANQSALAIRNAQQYLRTDQALGGRIEQLAALTAINQEIATTLNLKEVFRQVLNYALSGTRSTGGALLLPVRLRPESLEASLGIVAGRGFVYDGNTSVVRQLTVRRALETNQAAIEHTPYRSELSVPIAEEHITTGVITMFADRPDAYQLDDVAFVQQLATQTMIALDNARLFNRIEESRDRLQIILDSMHDAVLLLDISGTVLLANPQVEVLCGIHPSQLTGQPIETLLAQPGLNLAVCLGFTSEELNGLIHRMRAGQWLEVGNRKSYRVDEPTVRFINRTIVSTQTSDGALSGLLMVFADATEEREQAQVREDMTRMVVHDLRSPLTALATSIRLLGELASDDPALTNVLTRTTDATGRALRKVLGMVDSLLDIAKLESGTMKLECVPHMLAPIVLGARMEMMPLADELEIRIDVLIPDDLPDVLIDATKIDRVFLNLLDNALKFSPEMAAIQIRAARSTDRPDFVRVDVCDSGSGIPDSYKTRIFDRFQQVDGAAGRRRGTGLGLTFCKLTIEAHGGHIWIEDNPAGGSIFAFTLPIHAQS